LSSAVRRPPPPQGGAAAACPQGYVSTSCAPGWEQNGALCYPKCVGGYYGVGPVCWHHCPPGFRDGGMCCAKPPPYGRGAGYPLWDRGKCEREHSGGCEQCGLFIYPKCADNHHPAGCNICSPNCPDGWKDIGVSCTKPSYGRGAGKIPGSYCKSDSFQNKQIRLRHSPKLCLDLVGGVEKGSFLQIDKCDVKKNQLVDGKNQLVDGKNQPTDGNGLLAGAGGEGIEGIQIFSYDNDTLALKVSNLCLRNAPYYDTHGERSGEVILDACADQWDFRWDIQSSGLVVNMTDDEEYCLWKVDLHIPPKYSIYGATLKKNACPTDNPDATFDVVR